MTFETGPSDRWAPWLGIAFSALVFVGAAVMVAGASRMRLLSTTGPGSGFLPLIVGAVLALISVIFLLQRVVTLRRSRASNPAKAASRGLTQAGGPEAGSSPDAGIGRAAVIVASLCLLAWQLEYLGFQLSMLLFLLFHLKVLGRQGWVTTLIVAALGSFGVFLVFSGLLQVTLPRSDIPFLETWGL